VGEILSFFKYEKAEGATRPETLRQKDYWKGMVFKFRIDSGERLYDPIQG